MARTGKIARLPHALREQVNQRLLNNEKSTPILEWLNAQPEAIVIYERDFEGVPASPQNLSEWRGGGFRDWIKRRENLENIKSLTAYAQQVAENGMGLSGAAATIAAGQILETLETVAETVIEDEEGNTKDPADRLAKLSLATSALRSNDLKAAKLELEKLRHQLRVDSHALDREKFETTTAAKFVEWARSKEAAAILDSGKPKHELLAGIRKLMFGEAPSPA